MPQVSQHATNGGADAANREEDPIDSKAARAAAGLSAPAFWRAVAAGRLPAPFYPAPRAPRWYRSEIRAALAATRAMPADAKAARRAAKPSPPR